MLLSNWTNAERFFVWSTWHENSRGGITNAHHLESFYNCPCALADSIRALIREIVLTPESKTTIAGYPDISIEDARLIFIRNRGRDAWKSREANAFTQELINTPAPIKDCPRDQVINYIGFLHTMIHELRAYVQGMEIEYAREIEPELEANFKARETKKDSKRSAPKTLEGKLEKLGISKEALIEAIKRKMAADAAAKEQKQ
jgi:hypothetical protein